MTEEHIQDVIRKFAWTAHKAEELGANGVEIDAAHRYPVYEVVNPGQKFFVWKTLHDFAVETKVDRMPIHDWGWPSEVCINAVSCVSLGPTD